MQDAEYYILLHLDFSYTSYVFFTGSIVNTLLTPSGMYYNTYIVISIPQPNAVQP